MIDIQGVQPPTVPEPLRATTSTAGGGGKKAQPTEDVERVEASEVAKLAAKIRQIPPVREELIEQIKAELDAGNYENPHRIEVAVERLMEELFPEV